MFIDSLDVIEKDFVSKVRETKKFIADYCVLKGDSKNPNNLFFNNNYKFFSNSIIVTLYGNFESAIKRLFEEYLKKKNEILGSNFAQKEPMIIKNIREAIRCIDGSYDYRHDDCFKSSLRMSITESLCSDKEYIFCPELTMDSFMNAKLSEIKKAALNSLEIKDFEDEVKNNPNIVELIMNVFKINKEEAARRCKKSETLLKEIDEIVDARHKIAHSGGQSDLNDLEQIGNKNCLFFEKYISAVNSVLKTNLLFYCVTYKTDLITEIEPKTDIPTPNRVICFDNNSESICIGDSFLVVKKDGGSFCANTVKSIKKDDISCNKVVAGDHAGVELFNPVQSTDHIYCFKN